ncbi:MAG: polysaccharide lyase [Pseudomonadota bacterium]
MAKSDKFMMLVNGSGALIGVTLAGFFLWPLLTEDEDANGCFARYREAAVFGFANEGGEPRSPIELQAQAGRSERGFLHNVVIRAAEAAPAPAVLDVKLADGAEDAGLSFDWRPESLVGVNAACLRYQVLVPEGFDFRRQGVLPGIYGGERTTLGERPDAAQGIAARVIWRNKGEGEVNAQYSGAAQRQIGAAVGMRAFTLKPGRWTAIEQEVVLNTPGEKNGVLRLWVNGKPRIEDAHVEWRTDGSLTLSGVLADIGYVKQPGLGSKTAQAAEGPATLTVSPLELAW